MNGYVVRMTAAQNKSLRKHLFQNSLEQAAFLFARVSLEGPAKAFIVEDAYYVPPEGWVCQSRIHLELDDAERTRVMAAARRSGLSLVDIHSHPKTRRTVEFSPSDVYGITEFAPYVHWKLDRRPYVAMVWAPASVDGVVWLPGDPQPIGLAGVEVPTSSTPWRSCVGSWFWEKPTYE